MPAPADSGVPGLIDQYRQQRRAWLAQADELVRLRDEVRSAAEREAMDIVTTARRNVRQIVVEARRELMVLTAQLHAAMDAVEQSSAVAGLSLQSGDGNPAGSEASDAQTSLNVTRELVLGARREVRSVLDEARAEIEALASEAPVPFTSEETTSSTPAETEPEPGIGSIFDEEPPPAAPEARAFTFLDESSRSEKPLSPALSESAIFGNSESDRPPLDDTRRESPFVSRVLGSHDAHRTPPARSAMTFVALFAAVGAIVTAGTLWWLFADSKPAARAPETASNAVTAPPAESSAPVVETPAPVNGASSIPNPLSLRIEARRASWIRASVDGQPDGGRLYQAGETKEIVGARSVVIRAGDAGAVFVSMNGEPARALGENGAVMTRRYTLDAPAQTASRDNAPSADAVAARPAPPQGPQTPVALAVEKSPRPTPAPRADVRSAPPAGNPSPGIAASNPSRETPSNTETSARPDLIVAGQQWLDAYQRRDRQAMSTTGNDNVTVTDERGAAERFPTSQNGVQRELDQVELALTGDTALLTARMTEKADGVGSSHISRVSQIWVRRAGQWRLADVRIMAEARLNQIVR